MIASMAATSSAAAAFLPGCGGGATRCRAKCATIRAAAALAAGYAGWVISRLHAVGTQPLIASNTNLAGGRVPLHHGSRLSVMRGGPSRNQTGRIPTWWGSIPRRHFRESATFVQRDRRTLGRLSVLIRESTSKWNSGFDPSSGVLRRFLFKAGDHSTAIRRTRREAARSGGLFWH
jgi:hypothetical protein